MRKTWRDIAQRRREQVIHYVWLVEIKQYQRIQKVDAHLNRGEEY
jgi:hypothetical protein